MYPSRVLLLALAALAILAPAASATPLQPAAVAAGEQFWAAQNGGTAPCTGPIPLVIVYYDSQDDPDPGHASPAVGHPAWTRYGVKDCTIHVWTQVGALYGLGTQCAYVAHEIGHNWFGLDHSPDPSNVMNGDVLFVPPACARLDDPDAAVEPPAPAPAPRAAAHRRIGPLLARWRRLGRRATGR